MSYTEIDDVFKVVDFFDVGEKCSSQHSWEEEHQSLKALEATDNLRLLLEGPRVTRRAMYPERGMVHHVLPYHQRVLGSWTMQPFGAAFEAAGEGVTKRRSNLTARVEEAIETSRYILTLGDNWDEEGSLGYAESTWKHATQFVRHAATLFINEHRRHIEPPKITPGPDGSIDVRWKGAKRTLLINFPANDAEPADFFGSDKGRDTIKGTLDLSSPNLWLLMWLTR